MINPLYKLIIRKNYKDFWKKVPLSKDEDFQKLFVKMIHYNLYKRPNIDEILKDPFLEEINNKSEKEIKDLEIEMKGEFDKIREQIKEINTTENVNNKNNKNEDIPSIRGYSEEKKYSNNNLINNSKKEKYKKIRLKSISNIKLNSINTKSLIKENYSKIEKLLNNSKNEKDIYKIEDKKDNLIHG